MIINKNSFIRLKVNGENYTFNVPNIVCFSLDDKDFTVVTNSVDEAYAVYFFGGSSCSKECRERLYSKFLEFFNPTDFGDFND